MYSDDAICLMHDGVRPLIEHDIISLNIETVVKYGSAVTVAPATETIAVHDENDGVTKIIDRKMCQIDIGCNRFNWIKSC